MSFRNMVHFTTLENTPPDFMILGDDATQGHEHDCFGLGLGMLHLFTGFRPYEEILEDVKCPPHLKARLRNIWENESASGYAVIRTVISEYPSETILCIGFSSCLAFRRSNFSRRPAQKCGWRFQIRSNLAA